MKDETITISKSELQALIEAALAKREAATSGLTAESLASAFVAAQEKARPASVAQQQIDAVEAERRAAEAEYGAPIIARMTSELTGATFNAYACKSRKYPLGRIVRIGEYTYPEDFEARMPDGDMKAMPPIEREQSPDFKQWRWETFFKRDLQEYIGLPLNQKPIVATAPASLFHAAPLAK